MGSMWYEYKCQADNLVFYHNTGTDEHRCATCFCACTRKQVVLAAPYYIQNIEHPGVNFNVNDTSEAHNEARRSVAAQTEDESSSKPTKSYKTIGTNTEKITTAVSNVDQPVKFLLENETLLVYSEEEELKYPAETPVVSREERKQEMLLGNHDIDDGVSDMRSDTFMGAECRALEANVSENRIPEAVAVKHTANTNQEKLEKKTSTSPLCSTKAGKTRKPKCARKERIYKCSECEKTFNCNSHLVRHYRIHSGEKPFPCSYCEKKFTDNSNLTKHLRIHTGVKPYKCTTCDKAFTSASHVTMHHKSHERKALRQVVRATVHPANTEGQGQTNINLVKCEERSQSTETASLSMVEQTKEPLGSAVVQEFENSSVAVCDDDSMMREIKETSSTSDNDDVSCEEPISMAMISPFQADASPLQQRLKPHARVHNFKCSECGKAFDKRGHLARHFRIHSGEKPFSCPHCEKKFTDSSNRIKHLRIHTGERPYACNQCGRTFATASHRTSHLESHKRKSLQEAVEATMSQLRDSTAGTCAPLEHVDKEGQSGTSA